MKYSLTFEGDYYEDWEEIKDLMSIREMKKALYESKDIIRSRLKYESPSEEETKLLEKLQAILYMEGL